MFSGVEGFDGLVEGRLGLVLFLRRNLIKVRWVFGWVFVNGEWRV